MSERIIRKRRKEAIFSGEAVRFKTNNGPLHFLKTIFSARWSMPSGIDTLLLMVFVFVYSSNFLILLNPLDAIESLTFNEMGAGVSDARSADVELFKANVGIAIYVAVLIYSLFYIKPIVKVLVAHPHVVLIIVLLLFGMSYSVNPQQVFFSVIQISIGILIALVYAIQNSGKNRWDRKFCLTILFPLFLVHSCSLILFFANDINIIDFVLSSSRFGGLPGNPNVAGASAVVGVWTSLYLLLNGPNSKIIRMYCIVALCLFVFTIVMSGSGTATTVSIAVAALLIWLRFLTFFRSKFKRMIYVISGAFVMMILVGFIMINNTTEELTETFTSSLGKQSDFTGRTDLWDIAVAAIEEKPLLGWSFDQHETVQENRKFELPDNLGHFHNGFLDTAVAGGLILLAIVLWNIYSYISYCLKIWSRTDYLYGFAGPVVILVLMNLSEYSLLRPLSVIFVFYLCAYFLLILSATADTEDAHSAPEKTAKLLGRKIKSDIKRTSNGGKRYRF